MFSGTEGLVADATSVASPVPIWDPTGQCGRLAGRVLQNGKTCH
jgi:hypothetical protein